MEPARLRAMLARTPGLAAGHLFACLTDRHSDHPLLADLPARVLSRSLPPRSRAGCGFPAATRPAAGGAGHPVCRRRHPDADWPRIAQQACQPGKPVFAIPGSSRDPQAQGCNHWIRAGAILVQESCEILRDLGINNINQELTSLPKRDLKPGPGSSPLDNKYEMLLDAAGFEPVDIDVLAFRTGWSGHDVTARLLLLELQGRIAPRPGGWYCRLS